MREYTNVYWTLVGMRAAIDAARWLGKTDQASRWQCEYDDFYATFRKAADATCGTTPTATAICPSSWATWATTCRRRAQWAFCHAVFPGKVFAGRPAGPRQHGHAPGHRARRDGLRHGLGPTASGTISPRSTAHAWLWLGDGQRRPSCSMRLPTMPRRCWSGAKSRRPGEKGSKNVGDMPHNWASAEFIRLVRHLLVLERGNDLHLLEGMPRGMGTPGGVNRCRTCRRNSAPCRWNCASRKMAARPTSASIRPRAGKRTISSFIWASGPLPLVPRPWSNCRWPVRLRKRLLWPNKDGAKVVFVDQPMPRPPRRVSRKSDCSPTARAAAIPVRAGGPSSCATPPRRKRKKPSAANAKRPTTAWS